MLQECCPGVTRIIITSELYYMYINSIRERLREEQKKKENTKDTDDNTM